MSKIMRAFGDWNDQFCSKMGIVIKEIEITSLAIIMAFSYTFSYPGKTREMQEDSFLVRLQDRQLTVALRHQLLHLFHVFGSASRDSSSDIIDHSGMYPCVCPHILRVLQQANKSARIVNIDTGTSRRSEEETKIKVQNACCKGKEELLIGSLLVPKVTSYCRNRPSYSTKIAASSKMKHRAHRSILSYPLFRVQAYEFEWGLYVFTLSFSLESAARRGFWASA